jgi:hydroxymethylbilane synthase
MIPARLTIATRESALALWQAHHIRDRLQQLYPGLRIEILGMTTEGDRLLGASLAKLGGKGLFVKELENALAEQRADIAVHSMKDVPMHLAPGFCIAAIGEREDPRDAFVANRYRDLQELPAGAAVGTSSLRRESQIRARFPHLNVQPLRGNVNTRLRKLDEGQYACIILAAAGLRRLGLAQRITCLLEPADSVPAVGQGALGIECCDDRRDLIELLAPLEHSETAWCVRAERAVSRALAGSCVVPLGAYARREEDGMHLRGFVASPDGGRLVRGEVMCPSMQHDPESLGLELAEQLAAGGAREILAALDEPIVRGATALAGRVVVVTRPAGQGENLAQHVRAAGGTAFLFPALAIEPVAPPAHTVALLCDQRRFDWAVFVSANAVAHGLPHLLGGAAWPQGLRAAAVGASTAAALRARGVVEVLSPASGGDSESLLALPAMQQVSGQRVLVFRGAGGRELLADTLRARGAQVEYVECYRRVRPSADPEPLRERVRRGDLDAITAASSEALANLVELAGADLAPRLVELPVFVTHSRIGEAARRLGFSRVQVTPGSDEGLLQGMMAFFAAPG